MPKFGGLPQLDIKTELQKISERGYIPTLRPGDTGIGKSLESLLSIPENNNGEADFIFNGVPYELKSHRTGSSSRITLITKVPHWSPMSCRDIIETYGYPDKRGRQALKVTIASDRYNSQGLCLQFDDGVLNICHIEGGTIAYFSIEELMQSVRKKLYENLALVLADTGRKGGIECFHYTSAYLLRGLSYEGLMGLLKSGKIVYEFRMHIKENGAVRDHGPGFRINRDLLDGLYAQKEQILP